MINFAFTFQSLICMCYRHAIASPKMNHEKIPRGISIDATGFMENSYTSTSRSRFVNRDEIQSIHELGDRAKRRHSYVIGRRKRFLAIPLLFLSLLIIGTFIVISLLPANSSVVSKSTGKFIIEPSDMKIERTTDSEKRIEEYSDDVAVRPKCHIVMISTFPPRACGIATFSEDLANSLEGNELSWNVKEFTSSERKCKVSIIALNHWKEHHSTFYQDKRVKFQINSQLPDDFLRAAAWINIQAPDFVIFQHEFGILAQRGWEYVAMMNVLKAKSIIVLHSPRLLHHTVEDRVLIRQLVDGTSLGGIVMSQDAKNGLVYGFGVSEERLKYIPHGTRSYISPLLSKRIKQEYANNKGQISDKSSKEIGSTLNEMRVNAKKKLGLEGKNVIFTFGLLHSKKGINVMVEAMHTIVKTLPNSVYIIAGRPSPRQSERDVLEELKHTVVKMGLSNNVLFEPSFLSISSLSQYLTACDVFVTPYFEHTPVSGVLVNALSTYRAVVSTSYKYAMNVLKPLGRIAKPGDANELAEIISKVLTDCDFKHRLQLEAMNTILMRGYLWSDVALSYFNLFEGGKKDIVSFGNNEVFESDEEPSTIDFDDCFRPPNLGVLKQMPQSAYYNLLSDFDVTLNAKVLKISNTVQDSASKLFSVNRIAALFHLKNQWPKHIDCDSCDARQTKSKLIHLIVDSEGSAFLEGRRLRKGVHILSPISRTLYRPFRSKSRRKRREGKRKARKSTDSEAQTSWRFLSHIFPDYFGSNFDVTAPRVPDGFVALMYSEQRQHGIYTLHITVGDRYEIRLSMGPTLKHIKQEYMFLSEYVSPFGLLRKSWMCQMGHLGIDDGCGGLPSGRLGSEIDWDMVTGNSVDEEEDAYGERVSRLKVPDFWFFDPSGYSCYKIATLCDEDCESISKGVKQQQRKFGRGGKRARRSIMVPAPDLRLVYENGIRVVNMDSEIMWSLSSQCSTWKADPSLDNLFFDSVGKDCHVFGGKFNSLQEGIFCHSLCRENGEGNIQRKIPVMIQGPIYGLDDISLVNRELGIKLMKSYKNSIDVSFWNTEKGANGYKQLEDIHSKSQVKFFDQKMLTKSDRVFGADTLITVRNSQTVDDDSPLSPVWVQYVPWHFDSIPNRWIDLMKWKIDEIWTPSTYTKDALVRAGIPKRKIVVVAYGVDYDIFKPDVDPYTLSAECAEKESRFLFSGEFSRENGFDVLLDAYTQGFEEESVCLVLYGPVGSHRQTVLDAIEKGKRGESPLIVHIKDTLSNTKKASLYSAVSALIYPQRISGFSMNVAEALSSELPVVTSLTAGVGEICGSSQVQSDNSVEMDQQYTELDPLPCWNIQSIPAPCEGYPCGKQSVYNEHTDTHPYWNEPDVFSVVGAMKEVIKNRKDAKKRAKLGRSRIVSMFDWHLSAEIVRIRAEILKRRRG